MLHDIYNSKEKSSRYILNSFIHKDKFMRLVEEASIQNRYSDKKFIFTLDDGLSEHYWAAKLLNELRIETYIFAPTNPIINNHIIHSNLIQYLITSKMISEIYAYIEDYLKNEKVDKSTIEKYKLNNVKNSTWNEEMVFITNSLRYSKYGKKIIKVLFLKYISDEEKNNANNLYMNIEELKEISKLDKVLIGGHGSNSDILTEINSLKEEIEKSYNVLNDLGIEKKYFSYPNGIYNNKIINTLKEFGFQKGFTTNYKDNMFKTDNKYKINRVDIATLINTSNNSISEILRNL